MLSEIKNRIAHLWEEFQKINARRIEEKVDHVDIHFKMNADLAAGTAFVTGNPGAFFLAAACSDSMTSQRPGLFQDNPLLADGEADLSHVPDAGRPDTEEADGPGYTGCEAFKRGSACFVRRIAGRTFPENFDDGIPATEATLGMSDMSFDASGDLYLAVNCDSYPCTDFSRPRIRKIDRNGIISTVFPDMEVTPEAIAFGSDHSIFITDSDRCSLSRISPDGALSFIASSPSYWDCSGAPEAPISLQYPPFPLTADLSGNIYIAEAGIIVSKLSPDYELTPLINHEDGMWGFSGDGGAATRARVRFISGMAADAEGNLFLADTWNHRIRRYNVADGTIDTVAGSGETGDEIMEGEGWEMGGGFAGDGGPATSALLDHPYDVAVACDGTFFIADYDNDRVRMVQDGIISTYVGNGEANYVGEGSVPADAVAIPPVFLTLDASGALYIADAGHHIYKVECGIE